MQFTPSSREIRDMRVKDIVAKAVAGQITWLQAEKILGYSARHVHRLRHRCKVEGIENLRDRRAGRPMPGRISEDTMREIQHLRQVKYFDFNIKHFHEKLVEKHKMKVGYTYVKTLLQELSIHHVSPGIGERAET